MNKDDNDKDNAAPQAGTGKLKSIRLEDLKDVHGGITEPAEKKVRKQTICVTME